MYYICFKSCRVLIYQGSTSWKKKLMFVLFSTHVILWLTKLPSETKDPLRVQPHVRKCFEVSPIFFSSAQSVANFIQLLESPSSSLPPSVGDVLYLPHL